jgi:hypothetical protein
MVLSVVSLVETTRQGGDRQMLNLKFQERRFTTRKKLNGLMPGKVMLGPNEIKVRPVDIGRDGLGVVTNESLREGDRLQLHTAFGVILLEVMWSKNDLGKQDLFRFGLITTDPKDNLEEVFKNAGCLK